MTVDLSAFYFDVRKDALYCDPHSSLTRKACLTVLDQLYRCTVTWLAPMLCFTAEEAWLARYPGEESSVHLEPFPEIPADWRNDALAEKWRKVRTVRRVVTGALEVERAAKRIGSSLEAAPVVYVSNPDLFAALVDIDLAEVVDHVERDAGGRRGARGCVPPSRRRGRRGRAAACRREKVRALVENFAKRRLRSGLSRCDPARRAGVARMGRHAESGGVTWAVISMARSPASG